MLETAIYTQVNGEWHV